MFIMRNLLMLSLILACKSINPSGYAKEQHTDLKKHFDRLKLYDERCDFKSVFSELDTIKLVPKKEIESYLKSAILKPEHSWQRNDAILYAGILKLKGLKKLISGLSSSDINTVTTIYFYFYSIGYNKENHLRYLKYFCNINPKNRDIPPIIVKGMYSSIFLLGWIFKEEILDYLKSIDIKNLDGGLGEILLNSVDRIKYKLGKSK